MFCGPVIRSPAFCEAVLLGCELRKCLSVPAPLSGGGGLRRDWGELELGVSLPLG